MLQHREYAAHLLLILGFAVKLFGRGSGTEKCKQSLVPVPPVLTPEFVNRPADAGAVEPAGGIGVMYLGSSHEPPKDIRGQFFSPTGVTYDSGDDPGNASVVKMK